jgi:Right handed beta helix region
MPSTLICRLIAGVIFAFLVAPLQLAAAIDETLPPIAIDAIFARDPAAPSGRTFYVTPTGRGDGRTAGWPASLNNVQTRVAPGDTVILLAGDYASATWTASGAKGAPITLQASKPAVLLTTSGITPAANQGLSRFIGSALKVQGSYIVVDGLYFAGGNYGLHVFEAQAVRIARSQFREQLCRGVVVNILEPVSLPHPPARNVLIENNYFFNKSPPNTTGGCAGGTWLMDYGVALHDGGPYVVRKNLLEGYFHHGVSVKERVSRADILDNIFHDCGRWCIEVGQQVDLLYADGSLEESTNETALVAGNQMTARSSNSAQLGMKINNIRDAVVRRNVFDGFSKQAVLVEPNVSGPNPVPHTRWSLNAPIYPKSIYLTGNTVKGNTARIKFIGRGALGETITVADNKGLVSCSIGSFPTGSEANYASVQTYNAPTIVRRNGGAQCW